MSQTGRGKEVEREKEGSSTTKRFYFVIRRKKIETHRDAGNSLPYYAVSASSKVDE